MAKTISMGTLGISFSSLMTPSNSPKEVIIFIQKVFD